MTNPRRPADPVLEGVTVLGLSGVAIGFGVRLGWLLASAIFKSRKP